MILATIIWSVSIACVTTVSVIVWLSERKWRKRYWRALEEHMPREQTGKQ